MTEAMAAGPRSYSVGTFSFMDDRNFNFQMNRWLLWGQDPSMRDEMAAVAPRIASTRDWVREFKLLRQQAEESGRLRKAAIYGRAAEFFMSADDPDRPAFRKGFVEAMRAEQGILDRDVV